MWSKKITSSYRTHSFRIWKECSIIVSYQLSKKCSLRQVQTQHYTVYFIAHILVYTSSNVQPHNISHDLVNNIDNLYLSHREPIQWQMWPRDPLLWVHTSRMMSVISLSSWKTRRVQPSIINTLDTVSSIGDSLVPRPSFSMLCTEKWEIGDEAMLVTHCYFK